VIDLEIVGVTTLLLSILISIHSLFGVEIIKRGILFVDLAIGQMAGVGVAISILLFRGEFSTLFGLGFAILTALAIALVSKREEKVEPFIALIYAFGIASLSLVLSFAPHGSESINRLLATDILFITFDEVLKTAFIYFIVAIVYFTLLKKLIGFWREVLFFSLFAITVSISVNSVGVFVVFSILIAPAIIAKNIFKNRLIFWATLFGTTISFVAVLLSFYFDLSTGYVIIFILSLFAIASYMKVKI
jgi:zinc/manganese transport system permease protein